jgi:AcrR family transcriptional regulator
MTLTPWGRADELRARKLPPGPATPKDLVERNQRERLMGATVAAMAEKGYAATRVADILEIAGVSRNAFYRQFANKQDCFLATLEAIAVMTGRVVRNAYEKADGPWDKRLEAAFVAITELTVQHPAAARIGLVEVYAAGPEALDYLEGIDRRVERVILEELRESPERAEMPREIVRAVLGGLRKVMHTRVREGRERELPALVPGLLDWALSYRTPPQRLKRPRKPPKHLAAQRPPPDDARQRILYAVTDIVAEKSYHDMAITEIADRAAVSLTTFYVHFRGKEDAFLATLADAQRRVSEATLPVFLAAKDWPRSISAGARAFFGFLATDPTTAQLGVVGVWATGPAALDLRAQGMANFSALLDEGYRQYPGASLATAEAIGASVDALLFDKLRRTGAERLYEVAPTAAFITLAPFVGSEQAAEIANLEPPKVFA